MLETYNINSSNYYAHLTEASYDLAAAAAAAATSQKVDPSGSAGTPDGLQRAVAGSTSPSVIPKLEFEKGKG